MAQGPMPIYAQGSFSSALHLSAAAVVKATPGRVARIVFGGTVPTGGTFTVNDAATVAASTAANTIVAITGTSCTSGSVIAIDWPCKNGITVSTVPTGGALTYSVSYV